MLFYEKNEDNKIIDNQEDNKIVEYQESNDDLDNL